MMLRRAWVQFLLLGVFLFIAKQWAFPEPKPILGPPSPERISAMVENYARFSRGAVGEAVLANFVDVELRDELLFREAIKRDLQYRDMAVEQRIIRNMRFLDSATTASDALLIEQGYALRLHLTDEVIRRRMVQIMERLIVASSPVPPPSAEEIRVRYERDSANWQEPPRYTFRHVFLSEERRNEMPDVMEQVSSAQLGPDEARLLGAPFLSGYAFTKQSPEQMIRTFGAIFAEQLTAQDSAPQRWVGPIESVFGVHYVFIDAVEPARMLALEEVSLRIERDLVREAEEQLVADWVERAMTGYEVRRS
jgi:hypothetical protein